MTQTPVKLTRRDLLRSAVAVSLAAPALRAADPPTPRFRIAACDWMLQKRQSVGAFAVAKDCGLDGIEVDLGSLGTRPDFVNKLRDSAMVARYRDAARDTRVAVCSIAMSAFYGQSFAARPEADRFVDDWIRTMQALDVRVGFLPFGVKGDVRSDPSVRAAFVAALRRAAPKAEAAGVVLGIETNLDADGHKRFLDDVGSKAVQVTLNLGDAVERGEDLGRTIRDLGHERICQIHCKEGEVHLGEGAISFPRVREALDAIGWGGWLVIERSRRPGLSVRENFGANARYLRTIFPAT